MTDRELLELAAKAAGLEIHKQIQAKRDSSIDPEAAGLFIVNGSTWWNPLTDDGDALRLAVKLQIDIAFEGYPDIVWSDDNWSEPAGSDRYAATRRAIVRAAAEIGKGMK